MDYVFGNMKNLQLYHLVLYVTVYGWFAELVQSCETTSCLNGGTCQSHNNCSCVTGYAFTDCSALQCYNTATHMAYVGRYDKTKTGRTCQRWSSQSPHLHISNNDPASFPDATLADAGNYCRDPDNEGSLWCYTTDPDTRWETCGMSKCSGSDIDDCVDVECKNGGTCVDGIDSYTCTCVTGFTGQHCQSDIDDCEDVECQNGGTCVDGIDSYTCSCVTGFTGQHCQSDIDECSNNNGDCEQVCTNLPGSYNCGCNTGYNMQPDGQTCIDIIECETSTSDCQQTCTNTAGSYDCGCNTGYNLNVDQKSCIDIGECETSTSGCQQTCTNTVGSYNCGCNAGYSLNVDRKTCYDVDECNTNNGECEQVCNNLPGTHTCGCNTGYSLQTDGHTCIDIGECETSASGCQQTCTNTVGSYNCGCNTGYNLNVDRKTCHDIDECNNTNGNCEHICTNLPGTYICGCNTGYSLQIDGQTCKDQVSKHGKGEKQKKGSDLLIGLLVGAGVVIAIVSIGIVVLRWKSRQRKLARTLQTEASFVSLSMVRPDVQRPGSSISQYTRHPFDRKGLSTSQDNPTFKFNLTFNVIKRISLDDRSEKDTYKHKEHGGT